MAPSVPPPPPPPPHKSNFTKTDDKENSPNEKENYIDYNFQLAKKNNR